MARRPNPPAFRPIRPVVDRSPLDEAEEEARLEALAAKRGIARLETPLNAPAEGAATPSPEPSPEPALHPPPAKASPPQASSPKARARPSRKASPGKSGASEVIPARTTRAVPSSSEPLEPQRALTIELPESVLRALKRRALDQDCSVRHVIVEALVAAGVEVPAFARLPDGRRRRR